MSTFRKYLNKINEDMSFMIPDKGTAKDMLITLLEQIKKRTNDKNLLAHIKSTAKKFNLESWLRSEAEDMKIDKRIIELL